MPTGSKTGRQRRRQKKIKNAKKSIAAAEDEKELAANSITSGSAGLADDEEAGQSSDEEGALSKLLASLPKEEHDLVYKVVNRCLACGADFDSAVSYASGLCRTRSGIVGSNGIAKIADHGESTRLAVDSS